VFIGTGPVPGHGSIFSLASQMYALSMPSPNAFSKNKSGKEAYKIAERPVSSVTEPRKGLMIQLACLVRIGTKDSFRNG